MVDVSFFNDVLLYQDGNPQDTKYLCGDKKTARSGERIVPGNGTDAVFRSIVCCSGSAKNVVAFAEGFVVGEVDVEDYGSHPCLSARDGLIRLATVYVQTAFSCRKVPTIWSL